MSIAYSSNPILHPKLKVLKSKKSQDDFCRRPTSRACQDVPFNAEKSINRIREMFGKVELSVSSYDTAWVAMVPSKELPAQPCFPQCLDWIMENQHPDGCWGLIPGHPLLVKDSLSCTLASILALEKWGVGKQFVQRGLDYIGSNGFASNDTNQSSPIGFNLIFPRMISCAKELGLNLPLDPASVDLMLRTRRLEIDRAHQKTKVNLAYAAEGMDESWDWEEVLSYQRSNGSIFNSPATTAAAFMHLHNEKCFSYLDILLKENQNAVPTIYPLDLYTRLCMIDNLEKLGIRRHFEKEIKIILNDMYRCWQQKNEEIFLDAACCAMAFRILRLSRFEVSSDELMEFVEQDHFFNTRSPQFHSENTILELFKASQTTILQKEPVLENIHAWTSTFLKQQLLNGEIVDRRLHKEIVCALGNFHGTLERVENRRSIELYNTDCLHTLKTSYRCTNIYNSDFFELARQDFTYFQAIQQKELQILESWFLQSGLGSLKNVRFVLLVAYYLISSTLTTPEYSDARISHAQAIILITVADDLFDDHCSIEEIHNIIELVEKWDNHSATTYSSERVKIFFSALYTTINDQAAKGSIQQGQFIRDHLPSLWLDMLKGMMREVQWSRENLMPTLDEYLSCADKSIAIGPGVFSLVYRLPIKLSENAARSSEINNLTRHTAIVSRLLNDLQTFEKEQIQSKPNAVSILTNDENKVITMDEAKEKIGQMIDSSRRELLRMVLQQKGTSIPEICKDVFWKTIKMAYHVYISSDEYSSPQEMSRLMNSVLYEPIDLPSNLVGNNFSS